MQNKKQCQLIQYCFEPYDTSKVLLKPDLRYANFLVVTSGSCRFPLRLWSSGSVVTRHEIQALFETTGTSHIVEWRVAEPESFELFWVSHILEGLVSSSTEATERYVQESENNMKYKEFVHELFTILVSHFFIAAFIALFWSSHLWCLMALVNTLHLCIFSYSQNHLCSLWHLYTLYMVLLICNWVDWLICQDCYQNSTSIQESQYTSHKSKERKINPSSGTIILSVDDVRVL